MPPRRAVELRVGGQTYRVVGTEDDLHVQRLADLVNRKYVEIVPPGRGVTAQQAMFLTAMALAEEAEEQRSRASRLEGERDRSLRLASRAKEVVARLLQRVDSALSLTAPAPTAGETAKSGATSTRESRPSVGGDGPRQSPAAETRQFHSMEDRQSFPEVRQSRPTFSAPLDRITDPPDAINEAVMFDLLPPPSAELRPSAPGNQVRPPVSSEARHPAEPEEPEEAGVTRVPRGGLRLVRQSASPADDE